MTMSFLLRLFRFGLFLNLIADPPHGVDVFGLPRAPEYQLWNLNTRHSFNLKSVIIEPGCGMENLFDYMDDRPYNSNYATLTPGRSFYISLSLKFKS